VRDGNHLRRAEVPAAWPAYALEGKKWIDVSVLRQVLVAYEGTKPAFATLVSTGADGLGDPEETHSTVRGTFAIRTKHVSATMDSDELEDRFDLRDVPYVQYFHGGYALHAAYWHDGFGTPRSHGCINLHPTDASWLFRWTDPPVPDDWHGALAAAEGGTLIHVRP
jgi:lipoprotein-anchoring transpeptidase ErfK/SrfK